MGGVIVGILADLGHLFEWGIPHAVQSFQIFSYLAYTIKERISGDRDDTDLAKICGCYWKWSRWQSRFELE